MHSEMDGIGRTAPSPKSRENGVGLIVVILILAFMSTVGLALYSVTRSGPDVAANMRWHQMALNAAETAVDASLYYINENVLDFMGLYRTTYGGQPGLGDPASTSYFRKLSDAQIISDIQAHPDNYLSFAVAMPDAPDVTYTAFLVDNDGGYPVTNHMDALLVCIGRAPQNTFVRLELLISLE